MIMEKLFNNKNIIGIIWMLGFMVSITIMAICIRELIYKYSSFEIQNFRNIFSIIIIYIVFLLKKNINLNSKQLKNNFIRNIFHFIGQSAWTWGLTVLPLATVFSLDDTCSFCHDMHIRISAPGFFIRRPWPGAQVFLRLLTVHVKIP